MDIKKIHEEYCKGTYTYPYRVPQILSEDYVFDENRSVKENRESVRRYNEEIRIKRLEYQTKSAELLAKLRKDVVEYINDAYSITKDQADIVEAYVYDKKHSFMGEYFDTIDEVAQMVEDVLFVTW